MSAATLFASPFASIQDANGDPIVGAKISVFITGTTTPQPVYHDAGLSTEWTQPIVTNSAGQSDGPIFVASTPSLKLVVTTSADVPVPGYPMEPWTPYALADGSDTGGSTAGWLNVMDYGATGDGNTDDAAAIQACFNAATAINAGVFFPVPDDSYSIETGLVLNTTTSPTFSSLRGMSPDSTRIVWNGATDGICLVVSYEKGFSVSGLGLENGGSEGTTIGLLVTGPLTTGLQSTNGLWDLITVDGFHVGLLLGVATGHAVGEMTYRNLKVQNCGAGVTFDDLNTLNHTFEMFQASDNDLAMQIVTQTVSVDGFSVSGNTVDFDAMAPGTVTLANGRSENAGRFLTTSAHGGNGVIVIDNVKAAGSSNVDNILIEATDFVSLSIRDSILHGYLFIEAPNTSQDVYLELTGSILWAAPTTGLPWVVDLNSYDDANGMRLHAVGNFKGDPDSPSLEAILGIFPDFPFAYWSNGRYHPRVTLQPTGAVSGSEVYTTSGVNLQDLRSLQFGTSWASLSAGAAVVTGKNLRVRGTFATSDTLNYDFERAVTIATDTGSAAIEFPSGELTIADVGAKIVVTGGGAMGTDLTTYIVAVTSATEATLNRVVLATGSLSSVVGEDEPNDKYLVTSLVGNAAEIFYVSSQTASRIVFKSDNASSVATITATIMR